MKFLFKIKLIFLSLFLSEEQIKKIYKKNPSLDSISEPSYNDGLSEKYLFDFKNYSSGYRGTIINSNPTNGGFVAYSSFPSDADSTDQSDDPLAVAEQMALGGAWDKEII